MNLKHIVGMTVGAGLIWLSKNFWTQICYSVSETYASLDKVTCDGFKNFFFYFGIITLTISLISLIRNKN